MTLDEYLSYCHSQGCDRHSVTFLTRHANGKVEFEIKAEGNPDGLFLASNNGHCHTMLGSQHPKEATE